MIFIILCTHFLLHSIYTVHKSNKNKLMLKVRKGKFANVLEAAIKEALQQKAVQGAFRRTGIVPYDPTKIDTKWVVKRTIKGNFQITELLYLKTFANPHQLEVFFFSSDILSASKKLTKKRDNDFFLILQTSRYWHCFRFTL